MIVKKISIIQISEVVTQDSDNHNIIEVKYPALSSSAGCMVSKLEPTTRTTPQNKGPNNGLTIKLDQI